MIWFLVGLFSVVLMSFLLPMQFVIFIPPLAFFAVHLFFLFRKILVAEVVFLVMTVAILFINFKNVSGILTTETLKSNTQKTLPLPNMPIIFWQLPISIGTWLNTIYKTLKIMKASLVFMTALLLTHPPISLIKKM